jgi:hypothetical protein
MNVSIVTPGHDGIGSHTELGEGNQLAALGAGFIDEVDGLLGGKLEVEPARLGLDDGRFVLGDESHGDMWIHKRCFGD